MCSINAAQQYFSSTAEIFAKPDWESSPRSITRKLRDLVEEYKNNTPENLIEQINRVAVNVQKFEHRIHQRCRVKKPDAPIHPDPFWIYNGYEDALDSLILSMGSQSYKQYERRAREQYPDMLSTYGVHFEFFLMLDALKSYCQAIKDAPDIEARKARARAFAAEIKAANEEVATWKYPPFAK
ncbi:hypothetical protein FRC11_014293 [Ceratobasidium sp. 423]|nr:hypothetical protein FRC11_014293 [Ceratobasidium sp. 423]